MKAGPTRLFAALGVTAIVAAGLFALFFRMGGEQKALLFSGVSLREAGEIVEKLDAASIEYEMTPDGGAIFVPRSQVLQARMMLSADGLPSRGSVGYEIFDQPETLGQTQFQQNINRLRALEGELARTIASLDGVASARVHLVLPERQLFQRDTAQPTASIVLTLRRDELTSGQVRAVRNLVAGAVPGLRANRVTILDERGDLLAAAQDEDGQGVVGDGVDARQASTEERIRRTVTDIVEGIVGAGKARVQVSAEMDFNRVTESSERFDPEGRVVRSTSTSEETSTEPGRSGGAPASASANLPGGAGGASSGGGENNSSRTEETTNYEISKTTRTSVSEGGRVTKLSVAVAVDGAMTPGENGAAPTYTPRSEEELQRITALVRSAVGFNEERGDRVEVVNLQFARPEGAAEASGPAGPFDLSRLEPMRLAEIGAMLIAALATIFFVLRPLIGGLLRGGRPGGGGPDAIEGAPGAPALTGPSAVGGSASALPSGPVAGAYDAQIATAHLQGEARASSVKKVAELVERHPDESAEIIRGWLNNAA
ncbi:MAG: flagellar M-ring protein FliF [Hyphomonadaceae bacterium]|nr:flagellar M-ring protein FliF [Hyphomonadaceae bacterium]